MLDNEFQKTENTLHENSEEIYAKIAQLNMDLSDVIYEFNFLNVIRFFQFFFSF